MTNMDALMTLLFIRLYLSRDALLALKKTETTISKLLKALLEKNYIREKSIKASDDEKIISTTYYYLTLNGLRYLIRKKANPLVSAIREEDIRRATVVGTKPNKADWLQTVLRINDCAVLAALSGADVPIILNYPSLDRRPRDENLPSTFYDLAIEAVKKMKKEELEQMRCELYDVSAKRFVGNKFYTAAAVKKEVTRPSVSDRTANDFKRCRFSGYLRSHTKSVLLYSFYELTLQWNVWNASSDKNVLILMNNGVPQNEGHDAIVTTGYNAVLIVRNEVYLRKLYEEAGRKGNGKLFENNSYNHFYVVPLSRVGAENLSDDIMLHYDEKAEQQYIDFMLGTGCTRKPKCRNDFDPDFTVVTQEGYKTAFGCVIDINKINRIKETVEENPDEKYAILCYKWQIPYYRAIFGKSIQIYKAEKKQSV